MIVCSCNVFTDHDVRETLLAGDDVPRTTGESTIAWVAAHDADVVRAPFDASWTLRADIRVASEVTHQLSARLGLTRSFVDYSYRSAPASSALPQRTLRLPESGWPVAHHFAAWRQSQE